MSSVSPFGNSSALQEVVMGPRVKTLISNMFYNCSKLGTVVMSASMTEIGRGAFTGCNSIGLVECNAAEPPVCASDAFTSTVYGTAQLKVPEGCREAYAAADGWSLFTHIEGTLSGIGNVDIEGDCTVKVAGGRIIFDCPAGSVVAVYSVDGRLVYQGPACDLMPGRGVYIVRVGRHSVRVAV